MFIFPGSIPLDGLQELADIGRLWYLDQQMKMIGHQGVGVHLERMVIACLPHRIPQQFQVVGIVKEGPAFMGNARDEIYSIWHVPTPKPSSNRRLLFHLGSYALAVRMSAPEWRGYSDGRSECAILACPNRHVRMSAPEWRGYSDSRGECAILAGPNECALMGTPKWRYSYAGQFASGARWCQAGKLQRLDIRDHVHYYSHDVAYFT